MPLRHPSHAVSYLGLLAGLVLLFFSRLIRSSRVVLEIPSGWFLADTPHASPDPLPRAVTLVLCMMLGTTSVQAHAATLSLEPHAASPYTISDAAGSSFWCSDGGGAGGGVLNARRFWYAGWRRGVPSPRSRPGHPAPDPWNGMERRRHRLWLNRIHALPQQRAELGHIGHRLVGDRQGGYLYGLRVDHHVQFHKPCLTFHF